MISDQRRTESWPVWGGGGAQHGGTEFLKFSVVLGFLASVMKPNVGHSFQRPGKRGVSRSLAWLFLKTFLRPVTSRAVR